MKNQRITLTGYVMNEGDKNMANIAASGISGVFAVTNELRVVKQNRSLFALRLNPPYRQRKAIRVGPRLPISSVSADP